MPTIRLLPIRFAVAVGLVLVSLGLQWAIWGHIAPRAYLFVYPGLFFACLAGGLWPGVAATAVAAVGQAALFVPPTASERVALVGFVLMGIVFSLTGEVVRDHLDRQRAAKDALVDALSARDEFLSIASHELKTPLFALRLQLDLASRRAGADPRNERLQENLRHAIGQSDRLHRLASDLLDATRAQRGRLDLVYVPGDLATLVTEVAGRSEPELEAVGCTLDVRAEPGLHGAWDPQRLEQVVGNLLSNAARHAPGSPVEVDVRRDGTDAVVQIRDHGRGVPPHLRERVFERFVGRRDDGSRGGLGLGLYIVRAIVVAHGGRVDVTGEPGQGATFVVRLPLGAAGARTGSPAA